MLSVTNSTDCCGAERQSHVSEALDRLSMQVSDLESLVNSSLKKTDVALRQEPSVQGPVGQANPDSILTTPLAARIQEITDRVIEQNARLSDMVRRLEL